jgi:hypothetical protein
MTSPDDAGQLGTSLYAQVPPNRRKMGSFRVALGGTEILSIQLGNSSILPNPNLSKFKLS